MKKAVYGLVAGIVMVVLTGCTSSDELTALQEQIAGQAEQLEDLSGLVDRVESLSNLGEQVSELASSSETVSELQQTIADQAEKITAMEGTIADLQARLEALEGTGETNADGETIPEGYVPSLIP